MFTAYWNKARDWYRGLFRRKPKPRGVAYFEADELPQELPDFDLAVAREDGTLWTAGMHCPCGCGRRLEVMLLPGVKPRWDLRVDARGLPTLHPSIWVKDGCKAHFFLRAGMVEWC